MVFGGPREKFAKVWSKEAKTTEARERERGREGERERRSVDVGVSCWVGSERVLLGRVLRLRARQNIAHGGKVGVNVGVGGCERGARVFS